jgi:hypothetical protein
MPVRKFFGYLCVEVATSNGPEANFFRFGSRSDLTLRIRPEAL